MHKVLNRSVPDFCRDKEHIQNITGCVIILVVLPNGRQSQSGNFFLLKEDYNAPFDSLRRGNWAERRCSGRERERCSLSHRNREKNHPCHGRHFAEHVLGWLFFFSCTAVLDFHLRCVLRATAGREFPDISNWSSDISVRTALARQKDDWIMENLSQRTG